MSTPPTTDLARTFEDERWTWTRTRRARRRAVVAEVGLLAGLVATTLLAAASEAGWSTWYTAVWTTGLLAFIPLHSLLNLGIRGLFDRRRTSLDEHQLGLRERAFARMGGFASALTLLAFAGGVALVALTGRTELGLALGFLLWLAAGLLHYWHLAWTLPDEPADTDV